MTRAHLPTSLLLVALALPLAACSGGPQQPSDVVDDKTAESPYLGNETTSAGEESPSFADIGEVPPVAGGSAVDPIATASLTTRPADISAVAGRWAPDEAACATEGGPALLISQRRYESPERSCDVADVIDAGNGAVTATLSCASGDGAASELIKLAPAGEQLAVSVIGGGEPDQRFIRCP
jgi:hypothetical protein